MSNESSRILGSSAVMAAGTVVSRMSGFLRSALLAAALGTSTRADIFNVGNTLPNMIYILVAGGVFNAVLVPQLIRAMTSDGDQGEAYTNRIITLATLFLGTVTIALVIFAPQITGLYLNEKWDAPAVAAQRESLIAISRYCLPQVFFYGMFVLVGQVLNARGRFGPMMWAPIANNVLSVAVLVCYLFVFGPTARVDLRAALSPGQELFLGVGATAGIVAQFLILLPYLRAAGFTFRPRFDFRGTGLGHTMRLGMWTVLTVVANQLAYLVVVWLGSGGTLEDTEGTGYTVYSYTFLIMMVPHSIVTVSLATAALPRLSELAHEDRLESLGKAVGDTLRSALVVVLVFAAVLPWVAGDVARVLWDYGAAKGDTGRFVPSLALFPVGLVFFTVHYLMLRGFYALEQTRTVFFIQCAIASANMASAVLLVWLVSDRYTAPALVAAYCLAYLCGAVVSSVLLGQRCGGVEFSALGRFLLRFLPVVAITSLIAAVLSMLGAEMAGHWTDAPTLAVSAVRAAAIVLLASSVAVFLSRRLHIDEVTEVYDLVAGKLGPRLRPLARRLRRPGR